MPSGETYTSSVYVEGSKQGTSFSGCNAGVGLGGKTDNTGSCTSGSASTLPPYLAVYVWKRIA